MRGRWFALLASLVAVPVLAAPAFAAETPHAVECGLSTTEWCPSPPGDPCGVHKDTERCRADPKCIGMPYRGESVVACFIDERGFASNCPTVGCISRKPQ